MTFRISIVNLALVFVFYSMLAVAFDVVCGAAIEANGWGLWARVAVYSCFCCVADRLSVVVTGSDWLNVDVKP